MHAQSRKATTAVSSPIEWWPFFVANPAWIFMVAMLVRIMFFFSVLRQSPLHKIWDTGYEACHIAASIVLGQGFSSPFGVATGPTAWVPPGYVGILSILFRMFGAYSISAAWAALLLNAGFAAATALAIRSAGEKVFPTRTGVIAAWLWALSPYSIIMSIKIWESSLSSLLVMTGALLYWTLQNSASIRRWIAWGIFWGCAVLINPALAVFFPVLSIGAIWQDRRRLLLRPVLAAMLFAVVVAPSIVRNQVQLHQSFPIRSNFGEELWLGNHDGVTGPNDESRHPLGDPRELVAYRDLGERSFVDEKLHSAIVFIRIHPAEFAHLTLARIVHFWVSPKGSWWFLLSAFSFAGLVISSDFLRMLPFTVAMFLFPGVYYFTHADNWYRHPIEPMMSLLAVRALLAITNRLYSHVSKNGVEGTAA